jgi:hypothetical protein
MSYAVILYLIGENFRCFLLIVVLVTGVCLFIVYGLSAIIGYMDSWESTGEPGHVHIGVCAYLLRGVPGRYEYIWSLSWAGWRAGTGFLSFLALFWRVFARLSKWGGWRVGTIYFCISTCFGGSVRLKL